MARSSDDRNPQNTISDDALSVIDAELAWADCVPTDMLRDFARNYDWGRHPTIVLGWVMAQPQIDLGTALTVFFNGAPARFNTLARQDVPENLRDEARLLDAICQRMNAGYYLVWPESNDAVADCARDWLDAQDDDCASGRKGRYLLDPVILETMLDGALRLDPSRETACFAPKASLLRDVLSPVIGLGVSRHDLRYLPEPPSKVGPEIEQ